MTLLEDGDWVKQAARFDKRVNVKRGINTIKVIPATTMSIARLIKRSNKLSGAPHRLASGFFRLPFTQAYPESTAVFINELDPGRLQCSANGQIVG
jgi:hypothetical protein